MYEITEDIKKKVQEFRYDTLDVVAEGAVSIIASFVTDTVIGQVAPGICSAVMSYKQKRFEKNILKVLSELQSRQTYLDSIITTLSQDFNQTLKDHIFPMIFDYSSEVKQEDKIKFIVNGFETVIEARMVTNQEKILVYYDTLSDLSMIDLKLLERIKIEQVSTDILYPKPVKIETEELAIERQSLNKLQRLGIVSLPNLAYDYDQNNEMYYLRDIEFTQFGIRFINFFKINN